MSGRDDAAAEAPAYKVGDRVKARYRGAWGAMYEGTIKAVKTGADGLVYAVDFDDGDHDDGDPGDGVYGGQVPR